MSIRHISFALNPQKRTARYTLGGELGVRNHLFCKVTSEMGGPISARRTRLGLFRTQNIHTDTIQLPKSPAILSAADDKNFPFLLELVGIVTSHSVTCGYWQEMFLVSSLVGFVACCAQAARMHVAFPTRSVDLGSRRSKRQVAAVPSDPVRRWFYQDGLQPLPLFQGVGFGCVGGKKGGGSRSGS